MNFTFADVSRSYLTMVQQEVPKGFSSDADPAGPLNPSFAAKLSQTMVKAGQNNPETPFQTLSGKETAADDNILESLSQKLNQEKASSDNVLEGLSQKLDQEKGIHFVAALKHLFLILSRGDLKNVSIDADGLDALKKMLIKAGFKQGDVDDLMAELSEKLEAGSLTLDTFLDRLFDLPLEEKKVADNDQGYFLETSAIPFLESLLTSLGLPREKIQEIMAEADKGEKGISLDAVIKHLQPLQKNSFYTGDHYQTRAGDNNFRFLMKQMNLEPAEGKASPLTLDDLVKSLETLRKNLSQRQEPFAGEGIKNIEQNSVSSEKPLDLFHALFKGVKLDTTATETKGGEFSSDQIKNQFRNDLLVSVAEDPVKPVKSVLDPKEINGFKEMEALSGGKKTGPADMTDPLKEVRDGLRQGHPRKAALFDQGQTSVSDGRPNTAPSNVNLLKTGASFKNLPTYVTQQVGKSLVRAINQGENILKIQLKPPELGRLVMTIDNTGNSMKVSIMTDNHAARDILTSSANELKTVLSNSGVTLEKFEVDMNSNFRQSMADARHQTNDSGKRQKNRHNRLLDPVSGEGMNDAAGRLHAFARNGALHFVA